MNEMRLVANVSTHATVRSFFHHKSIGKHVKSQGNE